MSAVLKDGAVLEEVRAAGLFPLRNPEKIISIYQKSDSERKELGLITELGLFSDDQQRILRDYLAFAYFLPEILDVMRVTRSASVDEWDVLTDRGNKVFYLSGRRESITVTDDGIIILTDTNKCRYRITDYRRMRAQARILVERALP